MRTFFTIVLAIPFFALFVAFWLLWSITGFPTDTDDVVGVMRDADFHGTMLDVVDEAIRVQVNQIPDVQYAEYVLSQTRGAVEEILTEEWLYGSMETAHEGFVGFLASGEDKSVVDLRDTKDKLRTLLVGLGKEAMSRCKQFAGEDNEACSNTGEAAETYEHYKAEVFRALDKMPDETNMSTLIKQGGGDPDELRDNKEVEEAREVFRKLELARWAGLGGLAFLLLLIGLINMRSLKRMLLATGIVLAVSSGGYLGLTIGGGELAIEELRDRLEKESKHDLNTGDKIARMSSRVALEITMLAAARSIRRATTPVGIILLVSIGMIIGGAVMPGRPEDKPQSGRQLYGAG